MSPRRLKKCAAHQARQDGATAIMTRRRHYAARSLGVSALSIERRCRSVVWDRKKVRSKTESPQLSTWVELLVEKDFGSASPPTDSYTFEYA